MIPNVQVTQCDDGRGDFDMIIGMDVITLGDFSVTNVGGNTTFSFRWSSIKEIDYVQEADKLTAIDTKRPATGRKGQKYTPPKKKRKKRR